MGFVYQEVYMAKGIEHPHSDKKKPKFSLKEKRQRKQEKRDAKHRVSDSIVPQ